MLLLLPLLGITWTEVQPPQLPKQVPIVQGKGYLGRDRRCAVVSLRKGSKGISRRQEPRTEPCVMLI